MKEHFRVRATAGVQHQEGAEGGDPPGQSPQFPGSILFAMDMPLAESSGALPSEMRPSAGLRSSTLEALTDSGLSCSWPQLLWGQRGEGTPGLSLTPDTNFALPQAPPWGPGWMLVNQHRQGGDGHTGPLKVLLGPEHRKVRRDAHMHPLCPHHGSLFSAFLIWPGCHPLPHTPRAV